MKKFAPLFCLGLTLLFLCAFAPEIAQAAPGGIIKAAAKTGLGKAFIFVAVAVVFAPFIIYYFVASAKRTKKAQARLSELAATHPQYAWLDMKDRVTEVFYWVWSAWKEGKMSRAAEFTTPWYWQNQQHILDEWSAQGIENVCRVQEVSDIRPLFVQHNESGEGSRVVVAISALVVDYLKNTSTGEIIKGDTKEATLETVWTFKWDGGAWKLNLIEPTEKEWDYLKMTAQAPEVLQPQKA